MNRLFLVAITGECCLFALHGIKPRGYNPFVLLRKQLKLAGVDLKTTKHLPILEYLDQLYVDNDIPRSRILTDTLAKLRAIDELKAARKRAENENEPESHPDEPAPTEPISGEELYGIRDHDWSN